ncbi:membrane progestin receptor beta [Scleropages formosus]|uniref:Progestin and adipoQ receptor family member VIII n=1 Tax=Scleropages formosus TaxID=113540 RepID=A0A8C9QZC6_SCLFO|nr:membrane progestin receptor beta-like [Scleropages formosus]
MSSTVPRWFSTLSLSMKQLGRLPWLLDALPSLPAPRGTVGASEVPSLFREPYILSGYRPVGQDWRCYILSLFQRHNELLNVWTHLLTVPVVLLRCGAFVGAQGLTLEAPSLPLLLYMLSALTYLSFSTAAHLLQSHSELAHYSLFFLDYVGVGVYQYGCALAHYFYGSEAAWRESTVGTLYLPGAALLAWLSCAGCCFAKVRYRRPYPLLRKVYQLVPTGLAYVLVISPIAHRLVVGSWHDSTLTRHALQVLFFLTAAIFFSCPLPERLFPGCCDIVGHAHQIFHIFLALCTLCQLEALLEDFLAQRHSMLQVHREGHLLLACASFPILVFCCAVTAGAMCSSVQKQLRLKHE